nr:hypothetical protein [Tanacetum cinerariifolium]
MIQKKLPIKFKDLVMFSISCKMGNDEIERAMLDLGASINVMPRSIYEAMNVGKLKETWVIKQLADRSYAYPDGRPFLKIARINICVHGDTLTMEFDGQVIKFNTYDFMTYPGTEYLVFIIVVIDSLVQKVFELNDEDSLKVTLTNTISESANKELEPNSNLQEAISGLNSLALVNKFISYLGLPLNNVKLLSSIVQAPKLELKKLLGHLKLSLPMMEVVKKEIQKLLDTGIIYLISDSKWAPKLELKKLLGHLKLSPPMMEVVKKEIKKLLDTGNILGHIVSTKRLEVDKDKIDVIKSLPYPKHMREVRSFLGHAGFYRRFIKDFSKTSQPLFRLLQKDVAFEFDDDCKVAFDKLKEVLISSPIIQPLDWNLPFKIMSDASNYAVGVVFRQRVEKSAHVIYYALRTLDSAQCNYLATEKELLAIVFALEKF